MTHQHSQSKRLSTSILLTIILVQHSAWAHGGEHHRSTAQPKDNDAPQSTPIQSEPSQNGSTQPSQTASSASSSAEVTTETSVAPPPQNNVLAQIPTFGFAESFFGLILITPFGLTLLRRKAQNVRKAVNHSVK